MVGGPRKNTSVHTAVTDLSLILLVRSTASMSMRILYLTCGGTLMVQGYMSMKTTPAQNLFSSSRTEERRERSRSPEPKGIEELSALTTWIFSDVALRTRPQRCRSIPSELLSIT
ncbi:hypothetical protein EYF80_001208 [Liparis tanakae]|uniref:Uncharacterized protein n=1 Tax=Liparis tanakae TaxID=230148 RepID=A0A4Z2JDU9_9TELE|nr:hypothetical protein EYF80_001208 [Liparis tanakae]